MITLFDPRLHVDTVLPPTDWSQDMKTVIQGMLYEICVDIQYQPGSYSVNTLVVELVILLCSLGIPIFQPDGWKCIMVGSLTT